jgi:hypothetical protein
LETERTPLLNPNTAEENGSATQKGLLCATGFSSTGDEEAADGPSPTSTDSDTLSPEYPSRGAVIKLILTLLIGKFPCRCCWLEGPLIFVIPGVFISNMDGSILLATHSVISSEFDALSSSSWLLTSYALAMASVQTLVGCCDVSEAFI